MAPLSKAQIEVWSKKAKEYNTFIGGAGEHYTTALLLSSEMSLPPEAIQRYTVDNLNNILCRIDRTYNLNQTSLAQYYDRKFRDYLIDLDGKIVTMSNNAMNGVMNLKLRLPGLTGWSSLMNGTGSPKLVYAPEALTAAQFSFYDWVNGCNRLYIPKITAFTGTANQFNLFNNNNVTTRKHVIYVHPSMATNARVLVAQSAGATIRSVSNYDTPNKITDLATNYLGAKYVQFNFTVPTAGTNPIDFYEIWYEKTNSFRPERKYLPSDMELKNPNEYAIGFEPNTEYKLHFCTVDTMYNGTGMNSDILKRATSNEIIFTTAATDEFYLQNQLSAYWKLYLNSLDSSVNGLNGTDTSMTYAGGYAKFGTGYVDIADNNAFSFTDGVSDLSCHIALGFIWNDKTGLQFFISKRGNTTQIEWDIALVGSNIRFQLSNPTSATNAIKVEVPIAGISTGVLNTLQFSYNGSKLHTGLKAYLNGTSIGTSSMVGTYTGQVNGTSAVRIGDATFATYKWKADAKDIAIWKNRTMSAIEITEIDYRIKNNIPLI